MYVYIVLPANLYETCCITLKKTLNTVQILLLVLKHFWFLWLYFKTWAIAWHSFLFCWPLGWLALGVQICNLLGDEPKTSFLKEG